MIPSPGRIVKYKLNESDAAQISKRRSDARISGVAGSESGFIVHVGNPVSAGAEYPLIITNTWTTNDGGPVNGQVLLDGNDSLWVTSRVEGGDPGQWEPFPRV